jgi:hypothetical protein
MVIGKTKLKSLNNYKTMLKQDENLVKKAFSGIICKALPFSDLISNKSKKSRINKNYLVI